MQLDGEPWLGGGGSAGQLDASVRTCGARCRGALCVSPIEGQLSSPHPCCASPRLAGQGQKGLWSWMEEREPVTGLMSSACDVTAVFFSGALPVIAELLQSVCQTGTRSVQRN